MCTRGRRAQGRALSIAVGTWRWTLLSNRAHCLPVGKPSAQAPGTASTANFREFLSLDPQNLPVASCLAPSQRCVCTSCPPHPALEAELRPASCLEPPRGSWGGEQAVVLLGPLSHAPGCLPELSAGICCLWGPRAPETALGLGAATWQSHRQENRSCLHCPKTALLRLGPQQSWLAAEAGVPTGHVCRYTLVVCSVVSVLYG